MTRSCPLPLPSRRTVRVLAVHTRRPLTAAELTSAERRRLSAEPGGAARRREWLTSRRALRVLHGLLGLDQDTTSYTFPHPRVSLSHGPHASVAVAALHPVPELAGVGVDVEPDRPVRAGTARFFLSPEEQDWLATLPAPDRAQEQLRLWTVKEALFKADPGNHRTVLLDYRVDPAARCGRATRAGPGAPATAGYVSGRLPDAHLTVAVTFRRHPVPPPTATCDAADPAEEGATAMPAQTITFEEIVKRISATLNIPVEKLTPETTLQELAADSLLLVEMSVDLQEEFDVIFSQAELREVSTLGDLAQLISGS